MASPAAWVSRSKDSLFIFFVCVFNSPEPLVKAFLPFPGSEGVGVEIR